MTEVEEKYTERYKEEQRTIECPFCGKGKIDVTYVYPYMSWNVSRISAKSKRTKFYHDERYEVHEKCPECGKSRKEIKEALEQGHTKRLSHEDRIKLWKKRGLLLVLAGQN